MPIGDFGTKAKKNESMMACSYGPQDGNPRDSGLMFVQYWGYKSRGEWCSRLAQMYCDLGPKGRLNKKHIYEPFNGVEYYRKTAASIIQVEGYATCVDEDLLNMAKNQE